MAPSAREASSASAQCSNTVAVWSETVGLKKLSCSPGSERLAFEERDSFVEDSEVAGRLDVVGDGIGEPRTVVRDAGAHALTRMRQPPVLDIAFDELSRCSPQQMIAGQRGPRHGQRHAILQLIAEAIGAAGLIECRNAPRPDSSGSGKEASR